MLELGRAGQEGWDSPGPFYQVVGGGVFLFYFLRPTCFACDGHGLWALSSLISCILGIQGEEKRNAGEEVRTRGETRTHLNGTDS
jgi:hypothetical protein